jgi:hypothetical protein
MSWFGGGPTGHGRRVQPPRPHRGGGYESPAEPPAKLPKVDAGPASGVQVRPPKSVAPTVTPYDRNGAMFDAYMGIAPEKHTLVDETVTVDGVVYDVAKIRALLLERHQLAETALQAQLEVERLQVRLRQAGFHLRKRTDALTRLIARKGPHFDMTGRSSVKPYPDSAT